MSKAVLSTPDSTIMPPNALACLLRFEPVCSRVCVAVFQVFSLVFCEWAMHAPWYLVAHYFSIAIFSDEKSPPFTYEVAIENARSKNAA